MVFADNKFYSNVDKYFSVCYNIDNPIKILDVFLIEKKGGIMKKIKRIITGVLAAIWLAATALCVTSCVEGKTWRRDYYIHNGSTYFYVPGYEENVSERVHFGFNFDSQMFITEVYTDVSDKDRNFMCMSGYFVLNSVYIKEDVADEFSDIRPFKINEMTFASNGNTFTIRKEFCFGNILAENPVIMEEISTEWMSTYNMRCDLADYPLYYTDVKLYSDGMSVWVKIKETGQEYYLVEDEEFKTIFLEKCLKADV